MLSFRYENNQNNGQQNGIFFENFEDIIETISVRKGGLGVVTTPTEIGLDFHPFFLSHKALHPPGELCDRH